MDKSIVSLKIERIRAADFSQIDADNDLKLNWIDRRESAFIRG